MGTGLKGAYYSINSLKLQLPVSTGLGLLLARDCGLEVVILILIRGMRRERPG